MNKKFSLKALLAALLIIPLLALGACSSEGGRQTPDAGEGGGGEVAQTERIKVAMVTHAAPGDTFFDIVRKGAETAARKDNVEFLYASDPQASRQAQLIEQYVNQGVDGLIVANAHPRALEPSIERAVEADIPVVTMNAGDAVWKETGAITHFGQAEELAGEAAGEKLKELGFNNAICVIQAQGHVGLESRCQGIENTFGSSEILYVDEKDMSSVASTMTAKMQASDADVMVTLGAPYALTAIKSKEDTGSEIKVATFDMNAQAAQALADEKLEFVVDQQPFLQGYQSVDALWLNSLGGFKVGGGELVLTGPSIVTPDEAEQVLEFAKEGYR